MAGHKPFWTVSSRLHSIILILAHVAHGAAAQAEGARQPAQVVADEYDAGGGRSACVISEAFQQEICKGVSRCLMIYFGCRDVLRDFSRIAKRCQRIQIRIVYQ